MSKRFPEGWTDPNPCPHTVCGAVWYRRALWSCCAACGKRIRNLGFLRDPSGER